MCRSQYKKKEFMSFIKVISTYTCTAHSKHKLKTSRLISTCVLDQHHTPLLSTWLFKCQFLSRFFIQASTLNNPLVQYFDTHKKSNNGSIATVNVVYSYHA